MIPFADTPSLGMLIGLPIAAVLFLLCIGFATFAALDMAWSWVAGKLANPENEAKPYSNFPHDLKRISILPFLPP